MLKKVIGLIVGIIFISCILTIPVLADFELGDFTFDGEGTGNPTLMGWCTDGREGVESDLDLETLKSAVQLRIEFSEPIEGNLVFIMQSPANWWDQRDGVQNGTNVLVIDLESIPSWADFVADGNQANFFIGDWGTDYWADIKIVSATLITGDPVDVPESVIPPIEAWTPKEFKIGAGKTIIEAVGFDSGIYFESNAADGNHDLRPDEEVQTEVGASEFGGNIGWTAAGEWVQYTVTVETAGTYGFNVWLASDAGTPGNVEVFVDDVLVGASPNSLKRGWQNYDLFPVGVADLTAGTHVIKVVFPDGNMNFSALEINSDGSLVSEPEVPVTPPKDETPKPTPTPTPTPNPSVGDNAFILIVLVAALAGAFVISRRASRNRA